MDSADELGFQEAAMAKAARPAQVESIRKTIWSQHGLVMEKIALEDQEPRLLIAVNGHSERIEIHLNKAEAFSLCQTVMDSLRKFGRSSI